jgi:hypothetical protein
MNNETQQTLSSQGGANDQENEREANFKASADNPDRIENPDDLNEIRASDDLDEPNMNDADEIGTDLETGSQANAAIEQQGDDAATGIPRDTDAAKQQEKDNDDNHELTGAP